ncbi:MFS transporter [Niameybacter massiliensis]|uniref:MFS transporter n=1 Tax=Niameybacter massiliensis TaxID=1658108 RepID=UPI0006B61A18|nr:MFS transporter [Niameybacter massiliensis]
MNKRKMNKNFFILYFGQAISQLTSSILQMAIVWYLIAETNAPSIIALSGIMAFLPQGILGFFVGVYIDRSDRKQMMIVSDIVIALASLVIVIAGLGGNIPIWIIMVVLAVRSIGTAFHQPCLQAVTPLIVPESELSKYAGYSQTLQSISLILSPAIAAALFTVWKLEYIVFLDCIGAIIAIACIFVAKIPKNRETAEAVENHFFTEMKEGIVVLKENKLVGFMMAGAMFSIIYMPIFVLYPMMTLGYFNKSEWHAGFVEIIFAIGMLMGAVLLSRLKLKRNKIIYVAIATIGMGISLTFSGILSTQAFSGFVVLTALLGFASPFYQGLQTIVFQEKIENSYLGRVLSLSGALMVIGTPIGIAISGVMAEIIGVQTYFLISGIGIMVVGVVYAKIYMTTTRYN